MAGDLRFPRINSVVISGRVTRDIELRYTPKGTPIARISIAFDRVYYDNNHELQKVASFMDVVTFMKQAEECQKRLHKGSPIIVEGYLQARSWQDKDNNTRKTVEIQAQRVHFLEWDNSQPGGRQERFEDHPPTDEDIPADITDDDVPF